jgi:hypothetical protein
VENITAGELFDSLREETQRLKAQKDGERAT